VSGPIGIRLLSVLRGSQSRSNRFPNSRVVSLSVGNRLSVHNPKEGNGYKLNDRNDLISVFRINLLLRPCSTASSARWLLGLDLVCLPEDGEILDLVADIIVPPNGRN